MCGRYSSLTKDEIIEICNIIEGLSLQILHNDFKIESSHSGEVRPTDNAPVIIHRGTGAVSIEDLRWGFKKWDSTGVIINARVETLHIKPMFSRLLHEGRCVVPTREYYEWEKVGKNKVKHFVKDRDSNLIFMAGLYRKASKSGKGEYVIITKDAEGDVRKIHDRMPVILRVDQIEGWLSGKLQPEDIIKADFMMEVEPCAGEHVQLSL